MLIDKDVTAVPTAPSALLPMLRVYDRGKAFKSRFIHAKVIIAQGANADHVLFGSANCTVAALGAGTIPGINAEASLYRRLPPGSALTELNLAEVFASEPLLIADIPSRKLPEDEIELERLASANPGGFRLLGGELSWCPSPGYANVACDLALQDQRSEEVIVDLVPLQNDGPVRKYRVGAPAADAVPIFAIARRPGEQWSSPAIITYPQDIQIASRERGLRQLEKALAGLENTSFVSLQTLEIFDLLQKLDQADQGSEGQGGEGDALVPRKPREAKDAGGNYPVLTYDEFLNSRRDAGAEPGGRHHITLAGSSHFSIRSVLNRLLGASEKALEVEDDDAGVLDLAQSDESSETSVPDAGISTLRASGMTADPSELAASLTEIELAHSRNRQAERDRLLKAVSQFQTRLKEKQQAGKIDTIEMLRFRLMLMIVCQAAYSTDVKAVKRLPQDKVLAAEDQRNGWTDIVGRLIFSLINGADSPIRQLYLQNINGQVPVDLLECWATCYWCVQACFAAPVSTEQRRHLEKYLRPHVATLYQLTLPSRTELLGDTVLDIMARMSAVYGPMMGVGSVAEAHRLCAIGAVS